MTDKILSRREGAIGHLVFNNPERRNAIALEMYPAIEAALADFQADPDIRAVVMTGAGDKAFIAGADISQFESSRNSAETAARYAATAERGWAAMSDFRKPVIAAIQGFCIGGGLAVAMKADIRIATPDSTFAIPAARLGIAYAPHMVRDLVNLVGPSRAKIILFTAKRMSAQEAHAVGLIDIIAPAGGLEEAVAEITGPISQNAPLSMETSKAIINQIARDQPDPDEVARLVKACFDSADYKEGRTAFMEKRTPKFEGR